MAKMTLKDLSFRGKKVLLRVDFNVPMEGGKIADDSRIRASLPTIRTILEKGGSLILMSHLGRPKKKEPGLTLAPCAARLSELLGKPVEMASDCIGPQVEQMAAKLQPGQILLLENLRFDPAEENPEKDPSFTAQLAKLGDLYVNDAFGTAHRAHASTALIAKFFPQKAAMGLLMEKEIEELSPLLHNPQRPFYAIIGGAKVSTKSGVIQNLLKLVDGLFLGGGMTYTFLKARGVEIGASLFEESQLPLAKEILNQSSEKLHFPTDLVIADAFSEKAATRTILANQGIPAGWQGMDIGPQTISAWSNILEKGATIFWNGPLGVFEMPPFANGTQKIAELLSHLKAKTIIGGGDSVAAIQKMNLSDRFTHLSTGGGASLEFLEFGHLPGIDALSDKSLE